MNELAMIPQNKDGYLLYDLRMIPQDEDTHIVLSCLVKLFGAEVLSNSIFGGLFDSGKIALASRWKPL